MEDLICNFSLPLNASGTFPNEGDFWQFSKATCTIDYLSKYDDGTNTIYFSQVLDAGQVVIITFLILFLGFFIFKVIWNFFLGK